MIDLNGKVALVTGGGLGIGRGIARYLARCGAKVVVAELNAAAGEAVAGELAELGGEGLFVKTDVSVKAEVEGAVEAAVSRFGRLDILVNNAVKVPHDALLERKADSMLQQQLDIGVWGSWWSMRAALPHMKAQGGGRIINFTSGDIESGAWLHSDYNIAKAGIQALTRSAAVEWARFNILVNALMPVAASSAFEHMCDVRPGFREMANKANPLGRIGDPEFDIAPVVAFLASEEARYVSGTTIPVDGAMHLSRVSAKPADLSVFEKE